MPRPLIAITDSPFPSLDPAKKALARLDPEYRMAKSAVRRRHSRRRARRRRRARHLCQAAAANCLRQLKKCKAIGRFGLGVDNIDLPAAKELGIAVNYVPDYCLREVSDHAMALLLALARKVTFANSWCNPAAGRCRRSCRCAGSKAKCWGSSASAIFRARWRRKPRRSA